VLQERSVELSRPGRVTKALRLTLIKLQVERYLV
jgi:hypothetical protein